MQPTSSNSIKGNWATLLLPINKDQSLDWVALQEEVDILIQSSPNGIYSNGTAGEFYNQTESEYDEIQSILAESCIQANIPFQIGISCSNPQLMLERIQRMKELKPRAFQVVLPDWSRVSDEEMVLFLQKIIAEAQPVDIILYNPPHAKKVLLPNDYIFLLQNNIKLAGCKTGGGDQQWYEEMKVFKDDMSVFVPGHYLATGIKNGMQGAYSNIACLNPFAAQQWYELMLVNLDAALEIEGRIQLFLKNYILPLMTDQDRSNQAADKLLASIGDWGPVSTRLRWPYIGFNHEDALRLRTVAKNLLPEFFTKF
ncbi:dihydrodipicolinate synthase family protein [Membranihabitans marinus]|uniref:dihydrodipicolinate synthase family protein n=1 Tax=Membranihabitans marinus TaxID=1227546 RepID=UPI001F2ADC60|nr:dihydrodipicolinate synthase family protein [Membranihabitans marinus]